ncbi:MAG: Spy/CpxP family protein refolding chaperone [Candidatus Binatia bacterium]
MTKLFLAGALAWALVLSPPVYSGETERPRLAIPEDLADAWERLQRALQDWGAQLQERFGSRDLREDRPVITQILNYKDYLRLSPEQVKKLEQLRDNFQRQSIRNEADARIIELDIGALLDAPTVDVAKVEAKIREAEKLRADLRIARVRAIEQAKAVLTAEQRKKFYDSTDSRAARPPRGSQNPSATE